MAINFQDNFWLAKLSCLCSIFEKTNQLNLSLQGNGSNVFEVGSKIEAFKQKLKLWQWKVSICDFSDFQSLNNFMQTCKWEIKTTNLESTITSTVHKHLEVLQQNFGVYFSEDNYLSMNSLLWIAQPFTNEDFDLEYLTNKLIELRSDLVKKAEFKTFTNYTDFWVSLLSNLEYQTLAQKTISILVRMPSAYPCEQEFSSLVQIKLKKRNSIKDVDTLMRGVLETRLMPRFSQLADKIQQQQSH